MGADSLDRVIRRFYNEDKIVSGDSYLYLLDKCLLLILSALSANTILQHGRALPHYSGAVKNFFGRENTRFMDWTRSLRELAGFLPRFYSFWNFYQGFVQDSVNRTQGTSLTRLKRRITLIVQNRPIDMVQNVWHNTVNLLSAVMRERRGRI